MTDITKEDYKLGIKRLARLSGKHITLDEFLKECTYHSLQHLEDINPRPLPTRPAKLLEYDKAKGEGKKVSDKFWEDEGVRDYVSQEFKVIQSNFSDIIHLKDLLRNLEKYGDPEYTAKVRQRLNEFEDWKQENHNALRRYMR